MVNRLALRIRIALEEYTYLVDLHSSFVFSAFCDISIEISLSAEFGAECGSSCYDWSSSCYDNVRYYSFIRHQVYQIYPYPNTKRLYHGIIFVRNIYIDNEKSRQREKSGRVPQCKVVADSKTVRTLNPHKFPDKNVHFSILGQKDWYKNSRWHDKVTKSMKDLRYNVQVMAIFGTIVTNIFKSTTISWLISVKRIRSPHSFKE